MAAGNELSNKYPVRNASIQNRHNHSQTSLNHFAINELSCSKCGPVAGYICKTWASRRSCRACLAATSCATCEWRNRRMQSSNPATCSDSQQWFGQWPVDSDSAVDWFCLNYTVFYKDMSRDRSHDMSCDMIDMPYDMACDMSLYVSCVFAIICMICSCCMLFVRKQSRDLVVELSCSSLS